MRSDRVSRRKTNRKNKKLTNRSKRTRVKRSKKSKSSRKQHRRKRTNRRRFNMRGGADESENAWSNAFALIMNQKMRSYLRTLMGANIKPSVWKEYFHELEEWDRNVAKDANSDKINKEAAARRLLNIVKGKLNEPVQAESAQPQFQSAASPDPSSPAESVSPTMQEGAVDDELTEVNEARRRRGLGEIDDAERNRRADAAAVREAAKQAMKAKTILLI